MDGTTSYTTLANRAILLEKFPKCVISGLSTAIFFQLTPLDFFLWGYVKDRAFTSNPPTLDKLKANNATIEILPEMCHKVIEN